MRRWQPLAALGLIALSACSAADDLPAERPPADAGRDTKTVVRTDAASSDRLDASGGGYADEASSTPEPDVSVVDAPAPPPDAPLPPVDGSAPPDNTAPPPDGLAPPIDVIPPLSDATTDVAAPSCLVSFTVHGVTWSAADAGDAQSPGRVVRLVGDAVNLGSWAPTAGVPLTEISPGTWAGAITFRDQQLIEFKFVKISGAAPEWESWLPFDSNRSLRVECFADAGGVADATDAGADVVNMGDAPTDRVSDADATMADAPDAADGGGAQDGAGDAGTADRIEMDAADVFDAGPPTDAPVGSGPARGRTYVGVFGVRPPDATK